MDLDTTARRMGRYASRNPRDATVVLLALTIVQVSAWFYLATGRLYNGMFTKESLLAGVTAASIFGAFLTGIYAGMDMALPVEIGGE